MSWINEFEYSGKNLLRGLLFHPILLIVKNREEDRFWFLKLLGYLWIIGLISHCFEMWREVRLRRANGLWRKALLMEGLKSDELYRFLKYRHVHEELFRYHHKRQFLRKINDELLLIAWHPDRVYDWCFDEKQKGFLEEMWKS